MINPMNIYINKLAETAREMCNLNLEGLDNYILSEDNVIEAVQYFNGNLTHYASAEEMNNECGFEIKANSFLKKTAKNSFLIGYKEFIVLDILHELGHAILELNDMLVGETRLKGNYYGGINELNATKFARAFIMPLNIFQKVVIQNTKNGVCNIQEVANVFGVDYSQVISRGRESNLWD